ncbi:MAG: hypothetical protein M9890_07680 [Thermomicrobiales bacterium]|nr:hypothetical protein [Thermomicrobiales bacterium]
MSTTIQGATKGFSREAVDELSHRRQEPDWLRQKRIEAWEAFEQIPMPKRTDEEWRRTDLRLLPIDEVLPFADQADRLTSRADLPAAVAAEVEAAGEVSGVVVQRDSSIIYFEVDSALAEQGVVFSDLETAVREHPELLQKYFMSDATVPVTDNKFAALHGAFWTSTAFVLLRPAGRRGRSAIPGFLGSGSCRHRDVQPHPDRG